MVKQVGEVYADTRKELLKTEDAQSAAMIARYLVSQNTGITPGALLAQPTTPVSEKAQSAVSDGLNRLRRGEPLAYVLGNWDFYGLPLYVTPDVLIPRDDTCAVTGLAIHQGLFLPPNPRILDLCCGSGCIGLAIASRLKDARITLGDLSAPALTVAKKNIALHHMGGRVSTVVLNAMDEAPAFLGQFDMIVSNPPYITGAEMQELPHSVKDYEPEMALYGGEDGLDFYRAIVKNFTPRLRLHGFMAFEFGMGQGDSVCAILEQNGFTVVERKYDYNNRERAVLAQYAGKER